MGPASAGAATADTALRAQGLSFSRGGRRVFEGVGFELHAGQLLQVLGANGSGKTSLLRVLGGLLPADEGELCWGGEPVRSGEPEFLQAVAYLGHANGIDADLSAAENLRFAARMAGVDDSPARVTDALRAMGLDPASRAPVRTLSQGQRRRVALARLALLRRTLWLLDEPVSSLDAASGERFFAQLADHLRQGGMAVVATHELLPGASQTLQLQG
ncbi:cytochrome c biogenesis heme-transporting ATPase CcmA [Variovorax soli]|uniref:cytochrome c biogenesis heme-transporting ATPase CcmA n=1 Tax=Variovorax soli TaxID=376815 RepID=UPI00083894BC|nr:cytochrome c biogenesis heme-transporting ATPase CcmA [Variovorax soli]